MQSIGDITVHPIAISKVMKTAASRAFFGS